MLHCHAYLNKLQQLSTLLTVEGAAEAQVWITHLSTERCNTVGAYLHGVALTMLVLAYV